jgi:hypothetical protein
MTQETPNRRHRVVPLLAVLLLAGGGLTWRRLHGRQRAPAATSDIEVERRRVAAFDPSFDPAQPGGGLAGVVEDAAGKPVAGAVVAAIRRPGRNELPTVSRPLPRVATTGNDGRFQLADVLAGEYGVTATAPVGSPARQNKVAVASGKTTLLTLTLGKGGVLMTGEVTDVGGGGIAGAKALIRSTGIFVRPDDGPAVFQVVADDRGIFRVRLAAGDYDVTVKADGYSPARDRATLTTEQTRRYRLHPAARLAGRVLDGQSRQPVANASVWLRLDRLESYVDRDATTDGEGRFQFDDLAAGGYVVLARADRRIGIARTVTLGVAQAATDVEVLVDRGRAVRGKVVLSSDQPLADVRVAINRFDPPFERPAFAKSAADGTFTVEGLLPGKYRASAFAEGHGQAKVETVQVASHDIQGLRLVITEALVVRGQVLDAQGAPVAEANVMGTVESPDPERRLVLDRATTDAAGKFSLDRLAPGKLTLTARHADHGNARLGPEDAETVARSSLTLKLGTAATVSGTVKLEDGTPAVGVIVSAQPMMKMMFGPPDQASTDQAGHYRIGGLEKGRYNAFARRESMFTLTPGSHAEFMLEDGEEKTGVDLVVQTAGKQIAGKVLGPDNKPVSGAIVTSGLDRQGYAFRQPIREGGPSSPMAVSDPDGVFTLENLPDGVYTLWATDPAHADGEEKGVSAGATDVTIHLQSGASVAGVVRTRAGEPVTDYTIIALPGGDRGASPNDRGRNQMVARMWSPSVQVHDAAGAFLIGRLAPGPYELSATTGDGQGAVLSVAVAAGEQKQGLSLLVDAGAKVVGRVAEFDSGTPLAGATVQITVASNRLEGHTAADGSFTIEGVPPGHARADIRPPGDFSSETHIAENIEIDVRQGTPSIDVGVIKLIRGSYREKFGANFSNRGIIGFSPALLDGRPSVTAVRPGAPGEKAGLTHGELLLKIDGRSTEGLGNGALDFLAAGNIDKPLVLTVASRQGGSPREVTLHRAPIDADPTRPSPPSAKTTASATPTAAK